MNDSFADRCIGICKQKDIGNPLFIEAVSNALAKNGRLYYDASRNLFWIKGSGNNLKVAIWLMGFKVKSDGYEIQTRLSAPRPDIIGTIKRR